MVDVTNSCTAFAIESLGGAYLLVCMFVFVKDTSLLFLILPSTANLM